MGNYSARTSRWLEFEVEGSPQFQKPKTSTPTSTIGSGIEILSTKAEEVFLSLVSQSAQSIYSKYVVDKRNWV